MTIANNFDEFVEKVSEAERKALNMPAGQEMTQKLLEMKLAANPNLTPEEWQRTKSEFMTFLFAVFVRETPEAMQELGTGAALLPRFAEREVNTMNAAHFREMTDTQKHEYCMACAMRDNHAAMSEFYAYEKYLDKSIVIVKGRKIPIGTKGVCFYVGAVNYSKLKNWWDWTIRIGFKTENGETFFTSERNIALV